MAKKSVDAMPIETCGGCKFSHENLKKKLLCWGDKPVLLLDENSDHESARGSPTHAEDPACCDFKPRMHS